MENSNPSAMLEALRRRKMGEGVNLTIIVGNPDETQMNGVDQPGDMMPDDAMDEDETKELGMAPEATELGEDPTEKPLAPGDTDLAEAAQDGPGMMQGALDKSPLLGRNSMHARMKKGRV